MGQIFHLLYCNRSIFLYIYCYRSDRKSDPLQWTYNENLFFFFFYARLFLSISFDSRVFSNCFLSSLSPLSPFLLFFTFCLFLNLNPLYSENVLFFCLLFSSEKKRKGERKEIVFDFEILRSGWERERVRGSGWERGRGSGWFRGSER